MVDRLRVAVVGAGGWGAQHARIFSPAARHRARRDRRQRRGTQPTARAAEYGTRGYTDIDRMLAAERPRARHRVPAERSVTSSPPCELARTGIPLLVEKPLVFDLGEADRLLGSGRGIRSTFFAINFNHRYAEPVVRAKAAIDAGSSGSWCSPPGGSAARPTSESRRTPTSSRPNATDSTCSSTWPARSRSVAAQMTNATYGAWSTVAIARRVREPRRRHDARILRLVVRVSGLRSGSS